MADIYDRLAHLLSTDCMEYRFEDGLDVDSAADTLRTEIAKTHIPRERVEQALKAVRAWPTDSPRRITGADSASAVLGALLEEE
jgi:hypothetical protein